MAKLNLKIQKDFNAIQTHTHIYNTGNEVTEVLSDSGDLDKNILLIKIRTQISVSFIYYIIWETYEKIQYVYF